MVKSSRRAQENEKKHDVKRLRSVGELSRTNSARRVAGRTPNANLAVVSMQRVYVHNRHTVILKTGDGAKTDDWPTGQASIFATSGIFIVFVNYHTLSSAAIYWHSAQAVRACT